MPRDRTAVTDRMVNAEEDFAVQIRTARTLLGWTQSQLAAASRLPHRTVARIELADGRFRKRTLAAIRAALGVAGVVLSNGDGAGGLLNL